MLSPPTHFAGLSTKQVRVGKLLATMLALEAAAGLLGVSLLQQSSPYLTALAAMVAAVGLQELIVRTVRVRSVRAGWVLRLLRWGTIAAAALFGVSIGQPAVGIGFLLGFGLIEHTGFVLRRKVPTSQWPARLYI